MITPRRTTLIRVPDLRGLHRAIAGVCAARADARPTASDASPIALARATAVLVPSRAAAAQLRRTLERQWLLGAGQAGTVRAVVLPEILTRGEWYRRMLERSGGGSRLLSEIEREVLLAAAAREAVQAGSEPPFRMRSGLVAEMLAFHDTLRRQQRTVDDFERLVSEDLEPRAEFDRGAERLLRQTRFLVAAFRAFEARLAGADALDEHGLRLRLLASPTPVFRRLVVTVGDRVSDPSGGLYTADIDLLSRLPHLESVDILATREALLAGLGERLRDLLPGIEEREVDDDPSTPPALVLPASGPSVSCFVSRDREEELRDVARRIKAELREAPSRCCAVVFRRPLPYVYVGRTVFHAAGIEFQASDALPLAAEPFAAALDLVFSAVASRFARTPLRQLLASPHFVFMCEGREVDGRQLAALDNALSEAGYLGGLGRLQAFADQAAGLAAPAARAAAAVAADLASLGGAAPLSQHLETLTAFVRAHERLQDDDSQTAARHLRARAAVLRILEDLRAAALRYDDPALTLSDLAPWIRRWLESQTFTPTRGDGGVELVDAASARYGDFDEVHLAGLVAGDWPEAAGRNIFYPAFLLSRLGWPAESARLSAERAAFHDLLGLARERVSVSSFTLEDDSIVEPSPLLEEVERTAFPRLTSDALPVRVFSDEAVRAGVVEGSLLAPDARKWLALRSNRSHPSEPQFHGFVTAGLQPRLAPAIYTVTGLDRYLECPFKYFARAVLGLPEEATDEQGMSPKERGRFVHEVFRAFFTEWQAAGGGNLSVEQLDAARSLFARVADEKLAVLPGGEVAVERMRLLGSPASPGLGEIVLAAEAVRPALVVERLLEYPFEGEFELAAGGVTRRVRLRGKADRVDLLADGSLRIIDYKIGRAPDDSIQLPVYAICLREHLRRQGRGVEIGEALYIAFGDRQAPVEVVVAEGRKGGDVLEQAQARVLAAIDGIEGGSYPPRPAAPRLCGTCAYAAVCRKDVIGAD